MPVDSVPHLPQICCNTFDEQGYPTYHGFPIPEDQVPKEVLNKIFNNIKT